MLILKPRLVRGFGVCGDSVQQGRRSWRWWVPFAVLCIIAASRWILADQWPPLGSTLRSEAWACGVGALSMGGIAAVRRRRAPGLASGAGLLAVGAGLLALPALGAALHGPASAPLMRTFALCFVPVLVTVLCGIWSEGATQSLSLWPGLAGLGGAMLLFPPALPSDALGWAGLVAPPVAVSVACVLCRKTVRGVAAEWSAALLFAGGAVGLVLIEAWRGISSGVPADAFSMWAVVLDLTLVAMVVLVVLQVEPLRYSARYFVVPLITIAEDLLIFRFGVNPRMALGILLLAGGAVALLRVRGTDAGTSSLHLR